METLSALFPRCSVTGGHTHTYAHTHHPPPKPTHQKMASRNADNRVAEEMGHIKAHLLQSDVLEWPG